MNANAVFLSRGRSTLRRRLAQHLGTSWPVIAINVLVLLVAVLVSWLCVDWAIVAAVSPWSAANQCTDVTGACWPFLVEKAPLILFGTFPYEERWRPAVVSLVLIGASLVTLFQWLNWRWQAAAWVVAIGSFGVLMGGGVAGLPEVPNAQWNGLPVLLFLGACSLACALPVGLSLALARQSGRKRLSRPAVVVIETLRGIPMVAVLFFGVFVLPLLFSGWRLSPVHAALIVLIAFHGAYVAEDLRTGFLSVGAGQWDACKAVGLSHAQSLKLVILPQVGKAATPALTNTAIGGFKDTSLIVLVGLHDLLSTAKMSFGDAQWQKQALEAYVFVGLIFFIVSRGIAAAGKRLERLQQKW
ncbi:MAG: amino acid ABC transporter permease [Rhodoferax sp.]